RLPEHVPFAGPPARPAGKNGRTVRPAESAPPGIDFPGIIPIFGAVTTLLSAGKYRTVPDSVLEPSVLFPIFVRNKP
ncbi:hypothetical protein, partial [Alistipes shahii]|uniref:hypothetical protein n=5 Tax=Alistipes shahii TaxID=328814 RepID=UPI003AF752BE